MDQEHDSNITFKQLEDWFTDLINARIEEKRGTLIIEEEVSVGIFIQLTKTNNNDKTIS